MANYNLDTTYKVACERFAEKDPFEMAENSGAQYDEGAKVIKIKYLTDYYEVSYPQGDVKLCGSDQEVSIKIKILILHYLTTANGAPLRNEFISFKELPSGSIYIEPFTNRAIRPMLKVFQNDLDEFKRIGALLGGQETTIGDISITIYAFPRVPITYVIWSGDDEFPASGNILFDAAAGHYLPTEDYALVASLIVYDMAGMVKRN